jgi:D-tyrosyl-tRNA(Tyr) deacylase
MKALIQRVKRASVSVDGNTVGSIGKGYVVFLGIGKSDTEKHIPPLVNKILDLRLFPQGEKEGVFSIREKNGEILIVSQFTLYGDVKKGRRPSFDEAMPGREANFLYQAFVAAMKESGLRVETGIFGAMMDVELVNWGPYTIWIDMP